MNFGYHGIKQAGNQGVGIGGAILDIGVLGIRDQGGE